LVEVFEIAVATAEPSVSKDGFAYRRVVLMSA
jgi:hypothetical protein